MSAPGTSPASPSEVFARVDKNRVLESLTKSGLSPDAALTAAQAAVEAVGGFVTSADRNAGLRGERAAWRYIYEVWMVPENVADSRAA